MYNMQGILTSKDEWLVSLQLFLNVRLRTPSFRAVSRRSYYSSLNNNNINNNNNNNNNTPVSVPLPLPNSQYLIDGIMWSICDNYIWAADAWLTLQSHLHSCSQRYLQLCERLNLIHSHNSSEKNKENNKNNNLNTEESNDNEEERERLYSSHACMQDLYLAFCVIDAFLRYTSEISITGIKEIAERELPRLVADHFPIWKSIHNSNNNYIMDALEDYRLLFLDLLRSWVVTRLLRPDTNRRIEEYVRHKLKTIRDSLIESNNNNNNTEGNTSSISDGLRALMKGSGLGTNNNNNNNNNNSSSSAPKEKLRMTIANFISAIFPPPRSEAGRHRCAHCGVILKNINAKNTHYRYHFYNRTYQTEEKIVRLPYPSINDYIEHEVDSGQTGNFVRITENMLDVLRVQDKQFIHVRKSKKEEKSK